MELEDAKEDNNINYPDGWKTRRKHTVGIFFFSYFILGLDFTTIYSTMWQYVNEGTLSVINKSAKMTKFFAD